MGCPEIILPGLQKAAGHNHTTSGQKYCACTKYSMPRYPGPLDRAYSSLANLKIVTFPGTPPLFDGL
jgi:hypothetical protein